MQQGIYMQKQSCRVNLPWIRGAPFPTGEWHRAGREVASLWSQKQALYWLLSLLLAGLTWMPATGWRRRERAPSLPTAPPCRHGALWKDRKDNQPRDFYHTSLSNPLGVFCLFACFLQTLSFSLHWICHFIVKSWKAASISTKSFNLYLQQAARHHRNYHQGCIVCIYRLPSTLHFAATILKTGCLLQEKLFYVSFLLFPSFPCTVGLLSSWRSLKQWKVFIYLIADAFPVTLGNEWILITQIQ